MTQAADAQNILFLTPERNNHFENLRVIIFKWMLKKTGCEGLSWIRVAQDRSRQLVQANAGLIVFRERRGVFRLTDENVRTCAP